jgi:hypothetical protein
MSLSAGQQIKPAFNEVMDFIEKAYVEETTGYISYITTKCMVA